MLPEPPAMSEGKIKEEESMGMLTKDLDIVEDDSYAGFPHPIVSHTAIGARVLFAGGVNKQVGQQEASLVVAGNAGPILGPCDLRWRDPTGHTFQYETLAFGDNDSLGFQRVNDAGSLSGGPWRGKKEMVTHMNFPHPVSDDPAPERFRRLWA